MSNQFHQLQETAAVSLEKGQDQTLSSYPMFKVADFIRSLHCRLLNFTDEYWDRDGYKNRRTWIEEGLKCEVLNPCSGQWVKGKIRVKLTVEFCPDNPEDAPPVADSPLDEIRQSLIQGQES